jgi:crotonobetainyl-CoA:carnitine CoA-transferase CaiB-like acyl-CoA transferase
MLADMGADILKVEPPYGDELRTIGPQGPHNRSAYFDAVNAGKRSLRLDLRVDAGRDELLKLAETSDVVVESFRPGVLDKLGAGFPLMRRRNPRLVCCALNGFGVGGPLSHKAAHDINYLALAGTLNAAGPRERPMPFYPPVADCAGAMFAVSAILGAIVNRMRTGQGCAIDLALADAVMPFQLFQLADLDTVGHTPDREGSMMNGGAACYRIYPVAGGRFVSLGAIEPKFWQRFCKAAGRPDWIARQHEPSPQDRLIGEVEALFATLSLDEAIAKFEPADCCFAPVLTLQEAAASPHHAGRGLVRRGADGDLQALFPALVDGKPPTPRRPFREPPAPRG